MNLLSDEILLDTYLCACEVECEEEFIEILVHEIQLRGLKAPESNISKMGY